MFEKKIVLSYQGWQIIFCFLYDKFLGFVVKVDELCATAINLAKFKVTTGGCTSAPVPFPPIGHNICQLSP